MNFIKYKKKPVHLILATVIFGAFLATPSVSADDSVIDNIKITVPVSCTIAGTGMTSHNANINNGTYQANIGTTTLKAFCNDNNGFAIYAAGYTGNLVGEENSNKLLNTSLATNNVIVTGTATAAGNPDISNWAMKLSTDSGATYALTLDNGFGNYSSVPNEYTKVAHRDSGTDLGLSAAGASLTTTYAAYISRTQPAGSYSGQVIYTLVHPSTHNAPVACNPNATSIAEVKCMQDFAYATDAKRTTIINSMATGTQYTKKDRRDGKEYTIAKLADGNVWMTQNLDLDIDSGMTYTNEDTDIGYNTTTRQYDDAAWAPVSSTYQPTSTHIHEWCVGGTWNDKWGYCDNNNSPESYDPGDLFWNATESDFDDWSDYDDSCDYPSNTPSCDQSLNPISTYVSSTGRPQYHLGNYYNWPAALATNDASTYTTESVVEQSICPAGWTLPRAGVGEDSFHDLWQEYGYTKDSGFTDNSILWNNPLFFAAGGNYHGVLTYVGYGGGFWSSVGYGFFGAKFASYEIGNDATSSMNTNRDIGAPVRCIVRPVSTTYSE